MKRTRRVEVIRYRRRTHTDNEDGADHVDELLAAALKASAFEWEKPTNRIEPVLEEKTIGIKPRLRKLLRMPKKK